MWYLIYLKWDTYSCGGSGIHKSFRYIDPHRTTSFSHHSGLKICCHLCPYPLCGRIYRYHVTKYHTWDPWWSPSYNWVHLRIKSSNSHPWQLLTRFVCSPCNSHRDWTEGTTKAYSWKAHEHKVYDVGWTTTHLLETSSSQRGTYKIQPRTPRCWKHMGIAYHWCTNLRTR